ncbi:MAG: phthalate 4,5-dioxygenase [Chloroflexota bacterium]|jgi:phenylpropionate dioxygenase-like ring-hydroxylating dioxygenase large terminal subunit|nr:phthalate 4,5-dioxygenase [Chloroflexota bacterium]
MLTKDQNELLTRVGPGTPMGNLMRRYWAPAVLSWEVAEPDSPPVTIKLLGEELVVFRDTNGKVGVIGARCAHRRAHMFWGRNEEGGLRCVYHGWKFDVDGKCVDMPSEPAKSNFKDRVRIPSYPTHEVGGVVWTYMGPPDKQPAPPLFAWTQVAPERRAMSKVWEECNWLQTLEGGIDTVHSNFLHGGRPPGVRYDENDPRGRANNVSTAPELEVVPTDYGYTYAGIRDMGEEGTNHVRAYHWIMPWSQIRATGGNSGHLWVPMDDENTMVYNWSVHFEEPQASYPRRGAVPEAYGGGRVVDSEEAPVWFKDARMELAGGNRFGQDVDPESGFRSLRNRDNRYLIDRYTQKMQTFTGITGTNTQDRAIQESMGPIADRTLERLGTTDRAIIHARRALMQAVKTVQQGGDPPGVAPTFYGLRAYEAVLPKDQYWYDALHDKIDKRPEAHASTPA